MSGSHIDGNVNCGSSCEVTVTDSTNYYDSNSYSGNDSDSLNVRESNVIMTVKECKTGVITNYIATLKMKYISTVMTIIWQKMTSQG